MMDQQSKTVRHQGSRRINHTTTFSQACGALALGALAIASAMSPASANAAERWQYATVNADQGPAPTLTYGVPETDQVTLRATCLDTQRARVLMKADVGDLQAGEPMRVRLAGNGFVKSLRGAVVRQTGEGITGVAARLAFSDGLWQRLSTASPVRLVVAGYPVANLKADGAQAAISQFLRACRGKPTSPSRPLAGLPAATQTPLTAAPQFPPLRANTPQPAQTATQAATQVPPPEPPQTSVDQPTTASGFPVAQAFAAARDLGTADAWRAFLRAYPNGFHADLARAYLARANTASSPTPDRPATAAPARPSTTRSPLPQDRPRRPRTAPRPGAPVTADLRPSPRQGPSPRQPGPSAQQTPDRALPPLSIEPQGRPSWRPIRTRLPGSSFTVNAASVASEGLELVAYCGRDRRSKRAGLYLLIRERRARTYPQLVRYWRRALQEGQPSNVNPGYRSVALTFNNGKRSTAITGHLPAGTSALHLSASGRPVHTQPGFPSLMAAGSTTLRSSAITVRFSLRNSRRQICGVMRRCAIRSPECARFAR
ncbi:MAG: hypothetical protein AAFR04_11995 [Pseudomonadota bacterium]